MKREFPIGARNHGGANRIRRNRIVPRLEGLEDRTVLSPLIVTSSADSGPGSLRDTIGSAPSGATIEFAPDVTSITLTSGELDITQSLDIEGPGPNQLTISGNGASRVFDISGSAADVQIGGLTIADGQASGTTAVGPRGPVTLGGGLLNTGAQVLLTDVTLEDNQATGPLAEGGAVANVSGAHLDVSHCTFLDNQSNGTIRTSAGAIANDGASTLTLDHSSFTGNQVTTSLGAGAAGQGTALSGAVINAGGSQATVSYSTFEGNSVHGGNGANGTATAPNGGNAGTGVGGAMGNEITSLLVPFAPSTMNVAYSTFIDNRAVGGNGGNGGPGGNGGSVGGVGMYSPGGAINNGSSTLTVTYSTFIDNEAVGGNGGHGGAGGNGGAGGASAGGAISSINTPSALTGGMAIPATLQVSYSLFLGNEALGGVGGSGGSGGNGGAGGAGLGGGLRSLFSECNVSHGLFVGNQAVGGSGGDPGSGGTGGTGGAGQGGALINLSGTIGTVSETGTLSDSLIILNEATGGAGGVGGNGGAGQGGGAYSDATSSLTLLDSAIVFNQAIGGTAGSGGSDGQGIGGGVYVLGTFSVDSTTVITKNHASTSNESVGP